MTMPSSPPLSQEPKSCVRIFSGWTVPMAYFYEHREEADHHALTLTLRSLLFGSRKEAF